MYDEPKLAILGALTRERGLLAGGWPHATLAI